ENHECKKDTYPDIQDREPDKAHSQVCRLAAEADYCRGTDKRCTIGESNYHGVNVSPRDEIVFCGPGFFVPEIPQAEDYHQVDGGDDCDPEEACGHRSYTPVIPVQESVDDAGKSKRYAEQVRDPYLRVRNSKHERNLR